MGEHARTRSSTEPFSIAIMVINGVCLLPIRRFISEFGLDVSPADGLQGAALDAWIDQAERALLIALQVRS